MVQKRPQCCDYGVTKGYDIEFKGKNRNNGEGLKIAWRSAKDSSSLRRIQSDLDLTPLVVDQSELTVANIISLFFILLVQLSRAELRQV